MLQNDYRFTLEFHSAKGKPLGQVALDVDFAPACEWTRLMAARAGRLATGTYDRPARILPRWHSRLSRPYLEGFTVLIGSNGATEYSSEFTTSYMKAPAEEASSLLVKEGKIEAGEQFVFVAAAFPRQTDSGKASESAFDFDEEGTAPLDWKEGPLSHFERSATRQGELDTELPPAFIPDHVLDEAAALTRQAEKVETGGILIGHLHRDPAAPEIFLEVTAQIPATRAIAELTKLTFTAETWTAVRAAIKLRSREESMLGWWHSHPVKHWNCKQCPVERQRICGLSRDFFSEHDRALHRAVFLRAFNIAIVVNDVAFSDPTFSVFGWNRGVIEPRGYYLIDGRPAMHGSRPQEKGEENASSTKD